MAGHPLLMLRCDIIDRTIDAAADHPGAICTNGEADQVRALLRDARPVLETAPGVAKDGVEILERFIDAAAIFPFAIRLQVIDLTVSYVTVQLLHFASLKIERDLTPAEKEFGKTVLMNLMDRSFELLHAGGEALDEQTSLS